MAVLLVGSSRSIVSEQGHHHIVVILSVQFASAALHTLGNESKSLVKPNGGRVRRKHLQLYTLDAHGMRGTDGLSHQASADTLSPIVAQNAHTQRANMAETFKGISHDVTPTDNLGSLG